MNTALFLRGIVVGLAIAIPIGPIGVLCIQRTLADGVVRGIVTGLGSTTAHGIYAAIAGFGFVALGDSFHSGQTVLRLIGSGYLAWLALRIARSEPTVKRASGRGRGLLATYLSSFLVDITSPGTILLFAAIFAGLGTTSAAGRYDATAFLVLGVLVGSGLWWVVLSNGVNLLRARLTQGWLRWVNRFSALVLLGFALFVLAGLR
ncbi:MAG: LysE family transporter [Caldilineaceae bacterium]|nr:LysE family transporter [Caldilineaceae bacterium]